MVQKAKQKFATQVDADLLEVVKGIAREEGRQVQSLIDEALVDLVEKRRLSRPRRHVMATYRASIEPYAKLYRKLAE
jgi:hypothetical protein